MANSAGNREQEVQAYVEKSELPLAYGLLRSADDLSPVETYYLAYCLSKLYPDRFQEAIGLFDAAEARGLRSPWLLYHRSQLLASSGNTRRALKDATQLLLDNPLPDTMDFAANCLGTLSRSDQSSFSDTTTLSEFAAVFSFAWREIKRTQGLPPPRANPRIIEVDKGDFRAFVYENDIDSGPGRATLPERPCSAREFIARWDKSQDLICLLVAWYTAEEMPTAFLDIGSNLGTDCIRVAKLSGLLDINFPISAFEPGVMAALFPYTLSLNNVESLVSFEEACVSDSNKPVILFGEIGASTNNRMVNRDPPSEGVNKIVRATTLSEYLSNKKFVGRQPVMKIDTQGAEWKIWTGMRAELGKRHFSMILELTPWALRSTVVPETFISELLNSFFIFDLGCSRDRFVWVDTNTAPEWLVEIQSRKPHWTDLLCICRSLPSADRLIERIYRAANGTT